VAADKGQLAQLHKLREWAKDVLTQVELNNTLFLAKDGDECTAWHMETEKWQTVLLHHLWELAKAVLTGEDLNNMFLAKDGYENRLENDINKGPNRGITQLVGLG